MSGQRLMGVWQAVYLRNTKSNGQALKADVKFVTATLGGSPIINYIEKEFDGFFRSDVIVFDEYIEYVQSHLAKNAGIQILVASSIEDMCWEMCKEYYKLSECSIEQSDAHKLWQVYSRLCLPGAVPPTMEQEEANWIGENLSAQLGQHWISTNVPHSMCYGELMATLNEKCFTKAADSLVNKAVDDLHSWLVEEVAMTGWLYKRSRKQSNWTWWQRRWFVLVPGMLTYYDNNKKEKKKGEVVINSFTRLEELPDLKTLTRHYPFRFKVENSPYLELEMSADDDRQRRAWMGALQELLDATKNGTTPVQAILKTRMSQKIGTRMSIQEATSKMASFRLTKSDSAAIPNKPKRPIPQIMPINTGDSNVAEQINKIQEIFCKVDSDNNGAIDTMEFCTFIKGMGLNITDEEIANIFKNIEVNNDGIITLDEFTKYFMNSVLNENVDPNDNAEAKLQSAFLSADRDGTGTVDFREFAEYLWEKRRSMRMSKVISAFDNITHGDGDMSMNQFKKFFTNNKSILGAISEEGEGDGGDGGDGESLEGRLRNMYNDADATRIASYLRKRWEPFASFRRLGASGELVMSGGHGMVSDVLPGDYSLVDLACFSDLPPITPKHLVTKNISWIHAAEGEAHGKLIFPYGFSGVLPVDIATNEHLRYYGASFADSTQQQISLMYRHGIQDFTYQNKYLEDYVVKLNCGSGIEMHDFSHLDCPLQDDSGHFIMGKLVGNEIHLTAFKVPTRHTLYIPGGVIHSNDYLKGTWRTMLSDETDIDHVHIVRREGISTNSDTEHFEFTFA